MDIRFQPNNTHLENGQTFAQTDPHLKRLYKETYVYHSPLIQAFPINEPGIITLGGGRQIGKTNFPDTGGTMDGVFAQTKHSTTSYLFFFRRAH